MLHSDEHAQRGVHNGPLGLQAGEILSLFDQRIVDFDIGSHGSTFVYKLRFVYT